MAPLLSRLGAGRGGFGFGKNTASQEVVLAPFSMVLANVSSNNILTYNYSTDTFSSVTIGSSGTINQLHYSSSGLVAIASNDGSNSTVYRSTNNGASWSSIGTVGFTDVNRSRYPSKSGESIILHSSAVYNPPVRRSTNGGASWSSNITLPSFVSLGALATSSKSNGNWYYSGRYQGGTDYAAIWRSTNDGVSWTRVYANSAVLSQTNGKVTYNSNAARYVLANISYDGVTYQKPVYSSDGISWTNPGNGSGETFNIDNDVDASPTSYIGVSGDTGIYRSTDGLNWTSIDVSYLSGLTNNRTVVYDSTLGYYFVMGTSYFLVSDDDGLTWIKKSTVITGDYSQVAPLIIT